MWRGVYDLDANHILGESESTSTLGDLKCRNIQAHRQSSISLPKVFSRTRALALPIVVSKRLGLVLCIAVLLVLLFVSVLDPVSSLEDSPPGANADGVTNTSELIDAHREILEDDEHILRIRIGERSSASRLAYRADNSDKQAELHITGDGTQPSDVYINQTAWYKRDSQKYTRETRGRPFEEYSSNPIRKFGGWRFDEVSNLEDLISQYTYRAVNTTTQNNETDVRYEITGRKNVDRDDNLNGYLIVREDGFVRELTVNSDYRTLTIRYELREDIDVRRPEWTNEADRAFREGNDRGYGDDDWGDGDDDWIEWWD